MKLVEVLDRYSKDKYEQANTGIDYNSKILYPFGNLLCDVFKTPVVFDLASGKGEAADYLEDSLGISVVRGDLSADGLYMGRNSRVRLLADSLSFADGSFHGIHMKDALVHISDVHGLLKEVSRVLKPDGKVVITSAYPSRTNNFYYEEMGADHSKSVTIYDQKDYENQVEILMRQSNNVAVSPPYFVNSPDSLENAAVVNGLSLLNIGEWAPTNTSDWYRKSPRPVNRFVMLFEKK